MADQSAIDWCDSTFNPWTGCTKISPACDHCYAESWSRRAGEKVGKWGPGAPRVRTSAANWRKPLRWDAEPFWQCEFCLWRGAEGDVDAGAFCPNCAHGFLVPARRRVFCASLADVFDNEVADGWRMDLFQLIAATPRLDWLLLTKRIGNAGKYMQQDSLAFDLIAAGNVWLGATICNQAEADRDIPKLLAVPAAVRFLSIEPMLGPIDFRWHPAAHEATGETYREYLDRTGSVNHYEALRKVDWVIAGGESGAHARPSHPDWFRSLRDQCAVAGVPFLFKQWGEWQQGSARGKPDAMLLRDGRVLHDWTAAAVRKADIERRVPPERPEIMARVGKKAAGRLLDGRTHDGFPNTEANPRREAASA